MKNKSAVLFNAIAVCVVTAPASAQPRDESNIITISCPFEQRDGTPSETRYTLNRQQSTITVRTFIDDTPQEGPPKAYRAVITPDEVAFRQQAHPIIPPFNVSFDRTTLVRTSTNIETGAARTEQCSIIAEPSPEEDHRAF